MRKEIIFDDKEPNKYSGAYVFVSQEEALGSLMDMITELDATEFNDQDLENIRILENALSVKLSQTNHICCKEIECDKVFDDSSCDAIDSNFMKSIYNKFLKKMTEEKLDE